MSVCSCGLWEFNRAFYQIENDPEADAKIERLKQKYGVYQVLQRNLLEVRDQEHA